MAEIGLPAVRMLVPTHYTLLRIIIHSKQIWFVHLLKCRISHMCARAHMTYIMLYNLYFRSFHFQRFFYLALTILYFVSIILCVLRISLFTSCLQYSPRVWSSRNRFISFGYLCNIMCNVYIHNIILQYNVPVGTLLLYTYVFTKQAVKVNTFGDFLYYYYSAEMTKSTIQRMCFRCWIRHEIYFVLIRVVKDIQCL